MHTLAIRRLFSGQMADSRGPAIVHFHGATVARLDDMDLGQFVLRVSYVLE